MFRKITVALTVIFLSSQIYAQKSIEGLYKYNGGTLAVFDNSVFFLAGYGTMIMGKWEQQNSTITFTPSKPKQTFQLFGRHNNNLKDSIRIYFDGKFDDGNTFIQFKKTEAKDFVMDRIFNEEANCFSFPSVYKRKSDFSSISFTDIPFDLLEESAKENRKRPVYTFSNQENYNDFIAIYFHDNPNYNEFTARQKGRFLVFEDDESSEQVPFSSLEEFIEFLEKYRHQDLDKHLTPDELYYNPLYNHLEVLSLKETGYNYIYNAEKNAYIEPLNYSEDSGEDFHDFSLIYSFKAMRDFSIVEEKFKISKKSLFYYTCDK